MFNAYKISTLKLEKIKYFDKFKNSEKIEKNKKLKKKSVIIKYLKLKLHKRHKHKAYSLLQEMFYMFL